MVYDDEFPLRLPHSSPSPLCSSSLNYASEINYKSVQTGYSSVTETSLPNTHQQWFDFTGHCFPLIVLALAGLVSYLSSMSQYMHHSSQ